MQSSTDVRETLLIRAEALGWPAAVCSGRVMATEAAWRSIIARAFDVELQEASRQLHDLEAAAARERLPERPSAMDPPAMMNDEERAAQRAELAERERFVASERARQDEALRQKILADHGIA